MLTYIYRNSRSTNKQNMFTDWVCHVNPFMQSRLPVLKSKVAPDSISKSISVIRPTFYESYEKMQQTLLNISPHVDDNSI